MFRGYYDGAFSTSTAQTGMNALNIGTYLTFGGLNHGDPRNAPTSDCTSQYGLDVALYGYPANQQFVMPNAGFLVDVRIYSRALSASEVAALYGGTPLSPDTTSPVVSITAPSNNTTISGSVSLSASASDPVVSNQTTSGISTVQFKLDGVNLGSALTTPTSGSTYSGNWNTVGVSNGSHAITAVATDGAGNTTTSNTVTVTVNNIVLTPDVTPPTVPAGLTATVVSASQINLTWPASTDPVVQGAITSGLSGYNLYRGTTLIKTQSGTSYSDTGLTAATQYSYTVSAYDSATPANISAQSASVSAATQALSLTGNPPTMSNGQPSSSLPAGTTNATLSLTTDVNAACGYSSAANTAYSAMTQTFATTGAVNHSTPISGLGNGTAYTYYVRCQSSQGLVNTGDYIISFSVASANNGGGGGGGGGNGGGGGGGGNGGSTTPTTPPAPAPTPQGTFTPTVPQKPIVQMDVQLSQILADASTIYNYREATALNPTTKALYNLITKQSPRNLTTQAKYAIAYYIHHDLLTTKILGSGERTGVLNSYLTAFAKLPSTLVEWQDVIKIANGRWPSETSTTALAKAKVSFKQIYGREPNLTNTHDNAAVTVMAYGLRPSQRNLKSEQAAILSFKHIIKRAPTTASDWDIVRAIAYSGARR
jgi:hypothetical protein